MNAGTRDGEIGALVQSVRVLDPRTLRVKVLSKRALRFSYRHSNLGGKVVLGAQLRLKAGRADDIMKKLRANQKLRLKTQPVHTFNVGSVFKNPPGRFVAQLIQQAGLKGVRHGKARVSAKHANFIENRGGARAVEVLALVARIRRTVRRRFGVALELEMQVIGRRKS